MSQEIQVTRDGVSTLTAVVRYRWTAAADVPSGKTVNTSYYLNGAGALVTTYTNSGAITLTQVTIDGIATWTNNNGTLAAAMAVLGLAVQATALIYDTDPPGLVGAWVEQAALPFFDGDAFTEAGGGGGTQITINANPACLETLNGFR